MHLLFFFFWLFGFCGCLGVVWFVVGGVFFLVFFFYGWFWWLFWVFFFVFCCFFFFFFFFSFLLLIFECRDFVAANTGCTFFFLPTILSRSIVIV